ncbi:D-2-hydroxyacid dehydrogenase family protein [Geodermatophilus sp. DSM 44513]|uniref:D-2-hydroxyacid dehydrogenase family protein n=1 Tax=Geodermatophilus sp. DSM 44513 TaxID=1528104 RepID=UPI00127DE52E|nr:D-2-hydroxyacid dehydrogenase family protein [Geodermatophilus sp. DSM 44513]WNV74104.1 D-2-hydroxyacid dehydrogenase family protein [Geodermatophilus sp. DSM 44513]
MLRIAVLDDFQSAAAEFADWSRLPEAADVVSFPDHLDDEDAVAERLAGFDVVIAMRERTPFPRGLLQRLPRLRLLVTTGPRNSAIDLAAAADCGVTVCGTGAHPTGTVELTWALILAVARHVAAEDAGVRAGGWQHTVGTDLAGATLGVVGLGRLGTRVARIGAAFGMDVVAWSANLTAERAAEAGVRRVAKDELFATADVVTVHLVLSARTRGLVGAEELARMKPTAFLVNTSRGPIVDEAALLAALHEGRIGGAGLDVYDREPLPADSPVRTAPRTVLTPHLGYVTRDTYAVFYGEAVEDVAAFLRGAPVRVLHPG